MRKKWCRHCASWKQVWEGFDTFHEPFCCSDCANLIAKAEPRIIVELPQGWRTNAVGISDMTLPTAQQLEEGYEGVTWVARGPSQTLVVIWRGDFKQYFCEARLDVGEETRELRRFDYPHEVLAWLSHRFTLMGPFKAQ